MDRSCALIGQVYHNAWRELCEGMAAAGSLDEVIEVHETYLLSIQRQCFVVPDKLVRRVFCFFLEFFMIFASSVDWTLLMVFVFCLSVGSDCKPN